jgi:hypothetical protein
MLCARAMLAVGSLWNSTSSSPARLCRAALGRFRPSPLPPHFVGRARSEIESRYQLTPRDAEAAVALPLRWLLFSTRRFVGSSSFTAYFMPVLGFSRLICSRRLAPLSSGEPVRDNVLVERGHRDSGQQPGKAEAEGAASPWHNPGPQYTRSRDALKAIRPEGFIFRSHLIMEDDDGDLIYCYAFERRNDFALVGRTPTLPTEELAELHAIIQAIEYKRA